MQQQQTAGKPGVVRQSAWTRFVKDHGSILMFLILFVLASVFVKNFFAVRNIFTVIKQAAVPLVACMGLMLILTTGGIDLSLGYTLGLCSVLLGMMTKRYGFPAWQAIPLTLLIGAAVGLFNGALVQFLRVPAFIATLGSGYVLYGIAQIFGKGDAFYQLPEDLLAFGDARPLEGILESLPAAAQDNIFISQLGKLPMYVFISVIVVVLVYFLRHKTTYGRNLSAFGFNANTRERYLEADGTEVITEAENGRSLHIRPGGEVVYRGGIKSPLEITAQDELPTEAEAALGAGLLLRQLTRDLIGEAGLYLTSVQQSGDATLLQYDYQINGTPIRFSDGSCAAEVVLTGTSITGLTVRLRQYSASGESSLLLPLRQALAIAAERPGVELSLGYADGGGSTVSAGWLAD